MNPRISRSHPGPAAAAWLAAALLALLPATVFAQTTYTWNKTISEKWATAGNWTPTRSSPSNNDILVINGVTTPAPTITDLPTQTIGRLRIINNAQVTFLAAGDGRILTVSGNTSPAFEMQAGTALSFIDNRLLTIALTGSSTSSISGAIAFGGDAHRLTAANASQLTFLSGGSFTTNAAFAGNAFGNSGTANTVVFASGSIYRHNAGSDPFGLAAPSSRVVFQTGSTAIFRTATGFQSSGRTYANLTLQNNAAVTGSGTGNFQMQTLDVEAGSSFTHTGSSTASVTVTGNIQSAGSGNLAITAGSGGIAFAGSGTQTVGGGGGTGTITFGSNATVNAGITLGLSRALTFTAGSLTVNGHLTRNAGGSIAPAPTYGSTATLTYAAPVTVGNEWGLGAVVGLGVPRNVTVAAGGTVTMPTTDRTIPGDLTISSGTLAMNAGGGTLSVGGNWTNSGTFTPSGRTVVMNGTASQTLTRSGGETLFALQVNKTAGNLVLASSPATDLTLTGNTGDVLAIINAGSLDLGANTLTLSGAGGNVLVGGTAAGNRSILGTNTIAITGTKTVTNSNAKTLSTASGITVTLGAAVNFGASLTTIDGTLQMNAGGSVTTNPPTYGAAALLRYSQGGAVGRGLEWSATSGAGYPVHVRLTGNTTVDLANGVVATARQVAGTLTIDGGSTLSMGAMTATLLVIGNVDVAGTLALSTASAGDLRLQGNLVVSGTYTPNARAAIFEGAAAQTVSRSSGTLDVDFLRLAKTGGSLQLLSDVLADAPIGGPSLQFNGTTDVLDLNGRLLTLATTLGGTNANGAFRGSNSSSLAISGTGGFGTLRFTSGFESLQSLGVDRTSSGTVTLGTPLSVTTLTLTNGAIVTGSQTLVLAAAGNVTRTNGFVAGNFRKTVPTGASTVNFEVGSGPTYAPASVGFANVTTGGTLTASTTAGDHPNLATSFIEATKSVNRWWTITNAGVVFSTYDLTMNFPAGDVDAGAAPANFAVQKYNAPNWSFGAPGTMSATSAQTTGLTAFSDFAVGEIRTATITATAGANGSIAPSGAVVVLHGSSPVYTMGPNSGYQIQDVLVDGLSVGPVSSYTFNNVTANHTISVTFAINTYTLSIMIVGNGSVAASPNQATYPHGTIVMITATPDPGQQFSGWTGSLTSPLNPITIAMDDNRTLTATFTRIVLGYERAPFSAAYSPISTGSGAGTVLVTADDSTRTIPLPFHFLFSGIPYTPSNFLAVNANGFAYLSRSSVTTSSTSLGSNANLYGTSAPNGTLAPWYDDLSVGAVGTNPAGRVLFQTQGAVGSRRLTVQWTNVSSFTNTTGGQPRLINFQLVLNETSNEIEFRYGGVTGASHSSLESASIGLEDSVGGIFLDAVTGSRSTSNGMMTTSKWPVSFMRLKPLIPGTVPGGTYTVGSGGFYTSLSEAVADLNSKGQSGPVTLRLLNAVNDSTAITGGNIFPILLGPVAGNSATNSIVIEPASGRSILTYRGADAGNCGNGISATTITTSNEPIIGLVGADYVRIENVDLIGGGQVDRGLLLIPATRSDGSQNNTIRTVGVTLNRSNTSSTGVQQIVSVGPTSADGANSFNRYLGMNVSNCYAGISLAGNSAIFDTDCEVGGANGSPTIIGGDVQNDIGNGTSQTFGIRALNQANININSSIVHNVTGTGTSAVDGISLENQGAFSVSSGICRIVGNLVFTLNNTSASAGKVTGIRALLSANAGSQSRIYNNIVHDLHSSSTSASSRRIVGIMVQETGLGAGSVHNVDFNTVRLAPANLACSNTCLEIGTTTGPVVKARNNIFANFSGSQAGGAKHYDWVSPSAGSIGPAGSISDRNVLHINNTVNGFIGSAGNVDKATLTDWQGVAGSDPSSLTGNPQFVSSGNLHINPSTPTPVESAGSFFGGTLSWVPDDVDGNARAGTPDIGADEGSFVAPGSHDLASVTLIDPAPSNLKLTNAPFSPQASFENQGATSETNVPVRYRIRGPLPSTTIVYNQTSTIASMSAGSTQNVTFPSTSIAVGGFYTIEAVSELGTDVNAANDLVSATIEVAAPLAGDYPVGAGRAAPFNTLSAAVTRLNTVGVSASVRLLLEDASYGALESFPVTVNTVAGGNATKTVTIKPAPGAMPVVTGSSATGMVVLNGADDVIVDGSNTVGGTSRDLTLVNTNGGGTGAVVWGQTAVGNDGASRNTVKNVVARGSGNTVVGVGFGGVSISVTSNGSGNVQNRVENVAVERTQVGIYSGGSSGAGKNTGTVITGNALNAASPNHLTRAGIVVRYEDGIQITGNTIGAVASSAEVDVIGISLGLISVTSEVFTGDEVVNATVSRNRIDGVSSTSPTGFTAAGIVAARAGSGTNLIANNMVSGVISNAADPNVTVGILVGGGGTTRVWFNSVWMSGNRGIAPGPSLALAVGDSTNPIDARDNILVNTQTATGGSDSYAIGLAAGASFGNLTSNYNDLYTNSGLLGVIGGIANAGDAELLTITEWRTQVGRDVNSISADPKFTGTNDLHIDIKAAGGSPVANIGQVLAGITTDFDGENGNRTTTPDIGADEFATFNLNLTVVGSGSVVKNPNQSNYESGTVVQLTAVPATGWTFSGWSGSASGATSPINVTMNAHKNITATFVVSTYTLTVNTTGSGSVTKTPNQATYTHGTTVELTANPAVGWHFVSWSGGATGSTSPVIVTMDANRTVTATFAINTYTMNASSIGNGSVTKTPDQATYNHGATVNLTAVPAVGHHFTTWGGDATGSTNPLPVSMVANKTITATFAINTYALTVNTVGSGSVGKSPDQPSYNHGTSVELTATPALGWRLASWSGNASGATNPLMVTMDANKTITATFELDVYALTVNSGANGSVSKNPDLAQYLHGSTVDLTATPDLGFVFVGWGGDASGSANPLTVTMNANQTISATFGYPLATAVVGDGSIVRSPDQSSYAAGSIVNLTATPAVGWHFVQWSGDATGSANPLEVTMNASKSFTATFAINTYTLTASSGGNGAVTKDPDQPTYDHGSPVQLTATPDAGYMFVNWSGNASGVDNPLSVTMDASKSITATFSLSLHTLSANVVGNGAVARSPDQPVYAFGTIVQLTATPAVGWHFVGWSGNASGTTNPLDVTMDVNKTITATFEINTYTLAVTTAGSGSVSKSPDQAIYNHGTAVTLTATPAVGWTFTGWSGDASGTTNPLDVTMTANRSITATFTINTYTLAVTTAGSGSVSKSPDQPAYDHGTVVSLTATPAVGWTFTGWSGGASGIANPLDVTMTANRSITATFTINTYTLAVTTAGSGSVSKSPDQPAYNHGTVVSLTATPAVGWTFTGWSGDASGLANPLDVTMTANRSITATFTINTYTLDVSSGGNGSVTRTPDQPTYDHGTSVDVRGIPDAHYHFTAWGGDASGTDNPLTVGMDGNRTITATFAINTYALDVNVSGLGSVSKVPDQTLYDHGTNVELTVTPVAGHHFVEWSGDASGTANPLLVSMDGAKSITATFEINTYTLAVTTAGSGSVSKSPDQPAYDHGTVVSLTATPAVGWTFTGWSGDASGTTNPLDVTMTANRSITATFTINTYTLAVTTAGSGSVSKSPDQPAYDHGTVVSLTAIPAVGWTFTGWSGDASGTTNPLDVTMTANRSITATFTINTYTLAVTTAGSGSVSKSPDQPAYDHGTVVSLTATPAVGWTFTGWSGDASGTANPLDVTMTANRSITATFTINTYTLAVTTAGSGSVSKSPDQPAYDHGTVVSLTATPAVGWTFTGWSGDASGTTNPLDVTMTANRSITATFTINSYTLDVTSGGNGSVSKSPDQPTYDHGTSVELTAVPVTGYHLASWGGSASGSANPLSVTMDGDKTITATFEINTYVLTTTTFGGGSVTRNPDLAAYPHGQTVELTAVPLDGSHHFVEWTRAALGQGATNPITVVMDSAKTVGATFSLTEQEAPVTAVMSPNGTELLAEGQTASLTWSANDNVGVVAIDILLSRTGPSGPFENVAAAIANSGSYEWVVTVPATTSAYLKVVARDANGNTAEDLSDASFSILAQTTAVDGGIPGEFALAAVYPNPAPGPARIAFDLPREATVRVSILDLQGREVAVLDEGMRAAGRFVATWDGRTRAGRAATGVYFARFEAAGRSFSRRFVLTR